MKGLIIVALLLGAVVYGVSKSELLEDQVKCPYCLGAGWLVPDTAECGTWEQRGLLPKDSEKYTRCLTSHQCPKCLGAGLLGKSDAEGIPKGLHTLRDHGGRTAAIHK